MPTRHVLYVEDDPRHAQLLAATVKVLSLPIELHVVESATRALEFLGQRGRYAGAPVVSLVVLDLGLPLVSGHQLLEGLQQDMIFRAIPTVVYTRSRNDADVYLVGRLRVPFVYKDHSSFAVAQFCRQVCDLAHGTIAWTQVDGGSSSESR